MPAAHAPLALTLAQARLARIATQQLAAPADSPTAALRTSGFVRTLAGVDVYLALRARVPGLRREDVDAQAAAGAVRVVPSARGCIYLVPRADAPLCLRIAEHLSAARSAREHRIVGLGATEVEAAAQAVLAALRRHGPLTTDALRRVLPANAVRSLGDAGRKVGISSTLPPALRRLEFAGAIERRTESGRLDSERYVWTPSTTDPHGGTPLPDDLSGLATRLARVFLRAAGVASARDFAAWCGIALRDAKAAFDALDLVTVQVGGVTEPCMALAEAAATLQACADASDAIALLPFEDNLLALQGGPEFFVDVRHHGLRVPTWGRDATVPLGAAKHMSFRTVVAEGRVAGFWEYDPDASDVQVVLFEPVGAGTHKRLAALASDTGRFLREEVGHGRSFSLDTDQDLRQRVQALCRLGGTLVRGSGPTPRTARAPRRTRPVRTARRSKAATPPRRRAARPAGRRRR